MSDTIRFLAFGLLAVVAFAASRSARPADRKALFILGCASAGLGLLLVTDTIGATVEAIRASARNDGLYQGRRPLQAVVIIVVVLACLISLPFLLRIARANSRPAQFAIAGSVALFGFLVVRAISLHQVDAVLNRHGGLPRLNLGDSIELVSILVIAVLAHLASRNRPAAAEGD